ncbi:MAG: hypothetical protein KBT87_13345 [Gammaproteobacteria bacterium]|nr:hypothetical protein [Gammaproteobacteria bacterium]MBQ0775656.1 hypothetical protein [Gammaproteobacteria bacterium]
MSEVEINSKKIRDFLSEKIREKQRVSTGIDITDETLLVDVQLNSLKAMMIISSLKIIAPLNYQKALGKVRPMRTFGDMHYNSCALCGVDE